MNRRTIGLAAAPIAATAIYLAFPELPGQQRLVAAILSGTVVLWITEALPVWVTSLLSTVVLVASSALDPTHAAAAYTDPVLGLFVGSFVLAEAISRSGLGTRIARTLLSWDPAVRSPARLFAALIAVSCSLSFVMSNTGVAAMLLPIGIVIVDALGARRTPLATGIMLAIAWGASVSVGFLIATPPNLIAYRQIADTTGTEIGFVRWMAFGMPVTALLTLTVWALLYLRYGRSGPFDAAAAAAALPAGRGALAPSERRVVAVLGLTIAGWSLPELLSAAGLALPMRVLAPERVALAAAAVLLALPAADRPAGRVLTVREALSIKWSTIVLFAGGIALGKAVFLSGLADTVAGELARFAGPGDSFTVVLIAAAGACLLSELASNTASASVAVPIALELGAAAGVHPIAPALAAALGASLGFCMPVSTPPNSIVYSSGEVPAREMFRTGVLLDLAGVAVVTASLGVFLPLLGWW